MFFKIVEEHGIFTLSLVIFEEAFKVSTHDQ